MSYLGARIRDQKPIQDIAQKSVQEELILQSTKIQDDIT